MEAQEEGEQLGVGPSMYLEDRTPFSMGDTIAMKHADAGRESDTS